MGPGDEAFWDSCDALRTAEPRLSHSPLPLPPIPRQDMGMLNPREMHTGNEGDRRGFLGTLCSQVCQDSAASQGTPRFQGELYGQGEQAL